MRALCYLKTYATERDLRAALRLRWPDARVVSVDSTKSLLAAAPDVHVVFVEESPPEFDPELIRGLRASGVMGIIVLTSDPSDESMLQALDLGADDYLTVPISPWLLIGRLGTLLRRVLSASESKESSLRCGPLNIRPETHEAYLDGKEIRLTPTEFSLLYHLAMARGGTITSSALQKLIWECEEPLYIHTLRKYVQRLRKKLHDFAANNLEIVAIRGVGYRLSWPAEAESTA